MNLSSLHWKENIHDACNLSVCRVGISHLYTVASFACTCMCTLKMCILTNKKRKVFLNQDFWKHDPFEALKEENGDIYARGTQDMKSVGIQWVPVIIWSWIIREHWKCEISVCEQMCDIRSKCHALFPPKVLVSEHYKNSIFHDGIKGSVRHNRFLFLAWSIVYKFCRVLV